MKIRCVVGGSVAVAIAYAVGCHQPLDEPFITGDSTTDLAMAPAVALLAPTQPSDDGGPGGFTRQSMVVYASDPTEHTEGIHVIVCIGVGDCTRPGIDPSDPNISLTQWLQLLPSPGDGGEGSCEGTNGTSAELDCILDVNGTAQFFVATQGIAYTGAAGVPLVATSGTAKAATAHVEIGVPLDGASIRFVPSSVSVPFADDVQVECSSASNAPTCGRIVRSAAVALGLAGQGPSGDAAVPSGTPVDVGVQLVPEPDSPPGSTAYLASSPGCATAPVDSLAMTVDPSVGLSAPFYVCTNGESGHYLLSAVIVSGIQGTGATTAQAEVVAAGQPTFVSGTSHVVSASGGDLTLAVTATVIDCTGSPVSGIQLLPEPSGSAAIISSPDGGTDDAGTTSFSVNVPSVDGAVPPTAAVSVSLPQVHAQCAPLVLSVVP